MKRIAFSLALLLLSYCTPNRDQLAQVGVNPILLVFGFDISKSHVLTSVFDSTQLNLLETILTTSGREIVIASRSIGDTNYSFFSRQRLKPVFPINYDADLHTQVKQKKAAEHVKRSNALALLAFKRFYNEIISRQSTNRYTDLNDFADRALQLIQEPQFASFDKYVILHTDGVHDLGNDSGLDCNFSEIPSLRLCTVGWSSSEKCKAIDSYEFESFDGFIDFIIEQLNQ